MVDELTYKERIALFDYAVELLEKDYYQRNLPLATGGFILRRMSSISNEITNSIIEINHRAVPEPTQRIRAMKRILFARIYNLSARNVIIFLIPSSTRDASTQTGYPIVGNAIPEA